MKYKAGKSDQRSEGPFERKTKNKVALKPARAMSHERGERRGERFRKEKVSDLNYFVGR